MAAIRNGYKLINKTKPGQWNEAKAWMLGLDAGPGVASGLDVVCAQLIS